ncbi:MAG: DUF362 domain-containing protein [bacterium]
MTSVVYFGSAHQSQLRPEETLPAKLDRILERLRIRERVQGETVAIKMHLGGNIGYSTVHPVFVRKVVNAVREGGGNPFVCDLSGAIHTAYTRGYTAETLGCEIVPVEGPNEKYVYWVERPFKNIKRWGLGGFMRDATFLIDLAHIKGHPSCGFGGCIKNLALGGFVQETRAQIHDTNHHDPYWHKEKCPDEETRKKIVESCPLGGIIVDREDPEELHLHFENCNQCKRCLKVAPEGSLEIRPDNFEAFQQACAISTHIVLSTFDPEKRAFLSLATQMTPVCDCFGFTGLSILPDLGVFGSNDIVAIEKAVLDEIAKLKIIPENLPQCMEFQPNAGHPLQQIHGPYKDPYIAVRECERHGLGTQQYELVDIMPLEKSGAMDMYVSAGAH